MSKRHYKLLKKLTLTYSPDKRSKILGRRISYLIKRFTKKNSLNILDDGCGSGEIAKQLTEMGDIIGIDSGTKRISDWIKIPDIAFISSSGGNLPLKPQAVHVVVSQMVIEHVDSIDDYLREINRVLKNKGILMLAAPNSIFPIEGHTKLPFITYLPKSLFQKIVDAFAMKNYPVNKFTYSSLLKKVRKSGFSRIYDMTPDVIRTFYLDRSFVSKLVILWYRFIKFILPSWNWICIK